MTSRLLVDKLEGKTTSGTIQMPSGHVIQFIDTTFTTKTAINSDTYTTITDGTVTITPKFSNSKIMIMVCLSVFVNDSNTNYVFGRLNTFLSFK